jgi:hypothetical protein
MEELASRAEQLLRLRKRQFLTEDEYARRFDQLRQDYGLNPLARREGQEGFTGPLAGRDVL